MSNERDENPAIKPKDLVFILAIAGRIDAQSRILAKKLDDDRKIYQTYAVLDSLSSSYSMFKYFFDVCNGGSSDVMHDVMMSPGGIAVIVSETLFLVGFSLLAARFDSEKEDSYKKALATAWPYFRDIIKGLKNAYKGWRSALVAISLLGGHDFRYLVNPVGVALGIFAAANRFWSRRMVEQRKVMMNINAELLLEIRKLDALSEHEYASYLQRIQYQDFRSRSTAFVSVSLGGLIDGLYLYVGVLGLAPLPTPLFIAMVALCTFYALTCIITRLYEEYDFQLRLFITQSKCKIALTAKELETAYNNLQEINSRPISKDGDTDTINQLKSQISLLIFRFQQERITLQAQTNRTYLTAALLGIKNGLYAYGALASILFLLGSLLILSGMAFPPVLLVISICTGIIFLTGFLIHALYTNYKHLNKQPIVRSNYEQLLGMASTLKLEGACILDKELFLSSVQEGLSLDSSPQSFFQEWLEIIRSLFSGFGKGQKFIDFSGNFLQEADDQGHYHDTPIMYVLALASALVFGFSLALRALARGFGRTPLGQADLLVDENKTDFNEDVSTKTRAEPESGLGYDEPGSMDRLFSTTHDMSPANAPPQPDTTSLTPPATPKVVLGQSSDPGFFARIRHTLPPSMSSPNLAGTEKTAPVPTGTIEGLGSGHYTF